MNSTVEKTDIKQELQVKQDQLPSVETSEANGLMTLVERMAISPEIDPDRVERAFEMYKQVRAMDSEQAFNLAMSKTQSELETVTANMRNDHTGKNFANLSAIHQKCKPVWTKNGLSVSSRPRESSKDNYIKIVTTVRHSAGHSETFDYDYPLDTVGSGGKVNKTVIQGMGSSMEYGRRYQELLYFDIAIEGKDDDGGVLGEPITAEDAAKIKSELQRTNSNVKAFLSFVGAKDVDSMTPAQMEKGQKMLAKKAGKNGN